MKKQFKALSTVALMAGLLLSTSGFSTPDRAEWASETHSVATVNIVVSGGAMG